MNEKFEKTVRGFSTQLADFVQDIQMNNVCACAVKVNSSYFLIVANVNKEFPRMPRIREKTDFLMS